MTEQEKLVYDLITISQQQTTNIGSMLTAITAMNDKIDARPTKRSAFGFTVIVNLVTLLLVAGLIIFTFVETNHARAVAKGDRIDSTTAIICNEDKIMFYITQAATDVPIYKVHAECVETIEKELEVTIPPESITSSPISAQ